MNVFSPRRTPPWQLLAALLVSGLAVVSAGQAAEPEPKQAAAQTVAPAAGPADAAAALEALPEIPSRNLFQIMRAGGLLMIPILFCSMLMTVFVFERLLALRRSRVIPKPFVKRFLHQVESGQLDREQALDLCEQNSSAVSAIFAGAARKWGRPAVEVEQAVLDEGERAVNGLRKYIRVFNAVATITPLLGLLGTVFGMITAFNEIATSDAMGRPELLAKGISEALLTTAFGLTVAIPSLASYLFFVSRVDQLVIELDAIGQELVQMISAEALQDTSPRNRRREAA